MGPAIAVATSKSADGSNDSNLYLEAVGHLIVVSQSHVRPVLAAEVDAWCVLTSTEPVKTMGEAHLDERGRPCCPPRRSTEKRHSILILRRHMSRRFEAVIPIEDSPAEPESFAPPSAPVGDAPTEELPAVREPHDDEADGRAPKRDLEANDPGNQPGVCRAHVDPDVRFVAELDGKDFQKMFAKPGVSLATVSSIPRSAVRPTRPGYRRKTSCACDGS